MEKRTLTEDSTQMGFTLIEVLIALLIFAFFIVAFSSGMGNNLLDSASFKEDILLKNLCESKINELIINPPELKESLTLTKETKTFENNDDYTYTVAYKKFPVPDITKLQGKSASSLESLGNEEDKENQELNTKIFKTFKENMEKMLWQIEVQVKNKITEQSFTLSYWILHPSPEVKIDGF